MYYYSSCIDGHRRLLTHGREQSHLKCEPSVNVKIEVIPHYLTHNLVALILIVLDDISYTYILEGVEGVVKATAI